MLKVAVNVPTACGVNTMPYVQLELAGTLVAQVVLLAWMAQYGAVPLKPALLIAMAVVPAFWKVMVIGALVTPTFVAGKFSVVGETFTAVPSPLISKPCFSSVKLP